VAQARARRDGRLARLGLTLSEPLIAIVGAGPAGCACALGLAAFGVPCVLLDDGYAISDGSRATGLARRPLQLLTPSGVADEIMEFAVVQVANQAFAGTRELFCDRTPAEPGKYPRVVNVPQDRLERHLLGAIARRPSIELRRGHRVVAVDGDADGVGLDVEVDGRVDRVRADWLVACDGGRSTIRRALGLSLEGTRHDARFIVTDVRVRMGLPVGVRRIWFDPPSNPQGTIIMHEQPGDLWRMDFGVPPGTGVEEALEPAAVSARVAAHLELLGVDAPWELVWMGDYTATSVGLASYRHGRVLFAGDAAHLIPIFGGRGMNSAFEDGFNAAWKLAAVARGGADALLDSYSLERVEGARQNMAKAGIGAEVIAACSPGSLALRRAALELIGERRPVASLLNHRTSDANSYRGSPLVIDDERADGLAGRPGEALSDVRLGDGRHLIDALPDGFALLEVGSAEPQADDLPATLLGLPLERRFVRAEPDDEAGIYAAGAYLVRPDRYVMARGAPGSGAELAAAAAKLAVPV
jgi:3-(3-hydroxy-phenyl)propionate hydroxylase